MADKWTEALERIKAERERAAKIAMHKRLVRTAINRDRELSEIRALMR